MMTKVDDAPATVLGRTEHYWDGDPHELCRMPRDHKCWIRCDERSDTHHDPPILEPCPLCKTDKPQLTLNEQHYPEIFCRSCGISLSECDIPAVIQAWNTRTPHASAEALYEALKVARDGCAKASTDDNYHGNCCTARETLVTVAAALKAWEEGK